MSRDLIKTKFSIFYCFKPRLKDGISTQHIAAFFAQYLQAQTNDATFQRNILWRNVVARTRANDYNIMQHPGMLHEKLQHSKTEADNTQHVSTRPNRMANPP